jgi:hypothetical protein
MSGFMVIQITLASPLKTGGKARVEGDRSLRRQLE